MLVSTRAAAARISTRELAGGAAVFADLATASD